LKAVQLSDHFDSREFEIDAPIPTELLEIAREFCQQVLEPVRAFVAAPIRITSGYRPPEANTAAHGVSNSEHIWTPRWCAADFAFNPIQGLSVRAVFDWIRESTSIPFHQVILEHNSIGVSIIHISYNLDKIGVRQALEGATHNASPYTSWEVATFIRQTGEQENG
jgi:peptidase M15-like protein